MKSTILKFTQIGYSPKDSEEEKLRKSSLLVMAGPFAIAGLVWGILYFANGLILSGFIPFTYGLLSLASIYHFEQTKEYQFFRNSQLFLILILPFLLQTSLGGFVSGSSVIIWAIIAPVGALALDSLKKSLIWFAAFISLVIISYLINDQLSTNINWELSAGFIDALFLMNIIGVSSIVFLIQFYFVGRQGELKKDIESKNEELKRQSEKLTVMDELKSNFFANISHEFRTPLTLILGLINKQMTHSEILPSESDNMVLKRNAERLLQLINQLLDLSKLESGETQLDVSKQDIILFSKNMTSQFVSFAHEKNIHISLNGKQVNEKSTIPPFEFYFDVDKMQKIMVNLLSNAVKFTPKDGAISVDVVPNRKSITIEVGNTGDGIPQEKLPHIFDRFFQVDGATNRQYEGTGIGLALVKELVELHHGEISVESQNGFTLFKINLPIDDRSFDKEQIVNDVAELILESEALIVLPEISKKKADQSKIEESIKPGELEVLIVEDNPDLRAYIKEILSKNYKIIEAENGREGFEKAESSIPDLIVSDVMMPEVDGYELCNMLKTNEKTDHIPVILLTAKASRENKLEGLGIGADDYLVKPFDEAELEVRIKNLISLREKLQKKFQQEVILKPKAIKISSAHQKFLEKIKEIIDQNLDNSQFSVEDLGSEIGMSRSQLHRKLKALTNQTTSTFIRNYRLHRAADLLKQDAGNVTEIAYDVGFSSQTYFSSSFQELFGCSPSEYRMKVAEA